MASTPRFVGIEGQPLDVLLYTTPTCGYCHRVLRRATELGLDLQTRDASEAEAYADLVRIGGKSQVPCLVVDGRPLYESRDIIRFLETAVRSPTRSA